MWYLCPLNRSLPTKFFPYLLTYLFPYFPVDIVHVLGLSLRPRFGVAYIASLLKTVFEIFCFWEKWASAVLGRKPYGTTQSLYNPCIPIIYFLVYPSVSRKINLWGPRVLALYILDLEISYIHVEGNRALPNPSPSSSWRSHCSVPYI